MRCAIWKYNIAVGETTIVAVPAGAVPVAVGIQGAQPVAWLSVPLRTRDFELPQTVRFEVVATGEAHDPDRVGGYIGTFQIGGFVGHVFMAVERSPETQEAQR